ncbi:MAG: FIST C-terminal domain-containing protein [Elusimicrobia bacterium]|nr:FIST C-terminal domain-containing protein [Elusimicrobiota bacterium]
MEWLSVLSERSNTLQALEECTRKIGEIKKDPPDIAFLFPSTHHALEYGKLPSAIKQILLPKMVLGCSAGGVIAGGKEVEQKPALGLVCAWLPDVQIQPFHMEQDQMPNPDDSPKAWRELVGFTEKSSPNKPNILLLSDPFSLDPEELVRGLDFAFPGSVKIGGLASAAAQPGGNALYLNQNMFHSGAVGIVLSGNVAIDPIVAQGCRPIGVPFKITKCEENLLIELDGFTPLAILQKLFESLKEEDRKLARTSLFLGVLNDPMKSGASKKDYLIRNLLGMDPERGVLAVGAYLRPGQTIQFHLRDKHTSAQDLEELLTHYVKKKPATPPRGALLFSCMGRGENLYQIPNHDTKLFTKKMGSLPLGGFFCNGEIGPVEGATYLHGYTSCFGIFRQAHLP